MQLKVWLPTTLLLDEPVTKIRAEAENGHFCLLPLHVDFVTALVPGILTFETMNGNEEYLAVDRAILVKCGPEVLVSTRRAVRSQELQALRKTLEEQFRAQEERNRKTRAFEIKLEAELVRDLLETSRNA
jgi:F-type H+-transporting ATPase subunit epsilon